MDDLNKLIERLTRDLPKQSASPVKEFPRPAGTHRVTYYRELMPPQGKAGYVDLPDKMSTQETLKSAYASFNGVDEHKANYNGPSASVGDVLVLDRDGVNREAYRVQPSSFKKEPMQTKWDTARIPQRRGVHR